MKRIVLKQNHILNKPNVSYIVDYLGSLGVKPEDAQSFIDKPRPEDEESPSGLDNIGLAASIVYEGALAGKKFFIQVD